MPTLINYESGCNQWALISSVRNKNNYSINEIDKKCLIKTGKWFESWINELFGPQSDNLTREQFEYIVAAKLVHFFKFTEELERNIELDPFSRTLH